MDDSNKATIAVGSSIPAPIEISVVSPVYRAEELVSVLVDRICAALAPVVATFEIILVDDGSPDNGWEEIKKACQKDRRVVGIRLSRNFGQHYAISAGLGQARGRWIVVMDCDLQDQPEEIATLYQKALEGYDIVLARRANRQDGILKIASSRMFYGFLNYLTGVQQDATIANFGIYERKVITAINQMSESIRYFPTMVRWVGFKRTAIDVAHAARPAGGTSYNWSRLLNLALDIALSYSDKPLKLVVRAGTLVSLVGFVFAGYTVVQALRGRIVVLGYASLIVSLWLLAGLIILILGVIGLYIGKVFEGVKRRPPFIMSEIINREN